MNKIRVCAFLALVVFIGSVVTDMFSGFMDGWNEAGDQKDFHALPSVSLLVRADDTLPADTLISAAQDTPMYCNTSEVSVQGFRSTKWRWVSSCCFLRDCLRFTGSIVWRGWCLLPRKARCLCTRMCVGCASLSMR